MNNTQATIYIAGDSTAEAKTLIEKPMSGWGEHIHAFIDSTFRINNQAIGGRSTKSFLDQKRLDAILDEMKQGDYLLIQFGHNDQKIEDPTRYTEPFGSYQTNLRQFISKSREKEAIPVLLSSISRRVFRDGKVDRDSLGNYSEAMKQVALEEKATYIDVNRLSCDFLDELGEEKSKSLFLHIPERENPNYPEGLIDDTHFSELGGETFAKMIAEELKKQFKLFDKKTKETSR